jgi:hypothetical protein
MLALVHVLALPLGFVEARAFPAESTATHSATDGHEMALREPAGSTVAFVHALAPPVGLVEVNTSSPLVVAAQNETEGHETPLSLPR